MPVTPQEAWEATNPAQSEDERKAAAQRIMAGVAANDAYLNSRSGIEQVVALAKGGQVADPHAEREAQKEVQTGGGTVADIESTAVEVGKEVEKVAEAFPGELEATKKRLAELTGGKA